MSRMRSLKFVFNMVEHRSTWFADFYGPIGVGPKGSRLDRKNFGVRAG